MENGNAETEAPYEIPASSPEHRECLEAFRRGRQELSNFLETWLNQQEAMIGNAHKAGDSTGPSSSTRACGSTTGPESSKTSDGSIGPTSFTAADGSTGPTSCRRTDGSTGARTSASGWTPMLPSQAPDNNGDGVCRVESVPLPTSGPSGKLRLAPDQAVVATTSTASMSVLQVPNQRSSTGGDKRMSSFTKRMSNLSAITGSATSCTSWRTSDVANLRKSKESTESEYIAQIMGKLSINTDNEDFFQEKEAIEKAVRAAKETKVRRSISRQPTFLENSREPIRELVQSRYFEYLIAGMIGMSSVFVGWEVEHTAQAAVRSEFSQSIELPIQFTAAQYVFCAVFTLELALRAHGQGIQTFFTKKHERAWNFYDLLIVISSVVELVVSNEAEDASSLLVTVRIFRISRIVRIIRFMPVIGKELRQMVYSMWNTIASLVSASLIIFIVFYVFGIIFTQGTIDHLLSDDAHRQSLYSDSLVENFGTVATTMYTLFLSISGGVTWGEPVSNLFYVGKFYVSLFILFICFTLFAFLNVITGFFVDQAFDIAKVDKDQLIHDRVQNAENYAREFERLFHDFDLDKMGDITIDELMIGIEKEEVREYMMHLDIEVDKAWDLFRLLDTDEDGTLSMKEFIAGCMKLRGPAKSTDVAGVRKDIRQLTKALAHFVGYVHQAFGTLGVERVASSRGASSRARSNASILSRTSGTARQSTSGQLQSSGLIE